MSRKGCELAGHQPATRCHSRLIDGAHWSIHLGNGPSQRIEAVVCRSARFRAASRSTARYTVDLATPNRSPSSALEYSPEFNRATIWASCRDSVWVASPATGPWPSRPSCPDRDGGAERDAFDRGEERDGHQSGGDAQSEHCRHIGPADRTECCPTARAQGGIVPVDLARFMTVSGFASRRSRSVAAVAVSRRRHPIRDGVLGGW